jgi:hypothetical protein
MKTTTTAKNLHDEIHGNEEILCRRKQRWTAALFIGAVLGVITGCVGLVISALNLFGFLTRYEGVVRLGTLLVALAFPLMMFGAHAMDKIAEIDRHEKRRIIEEKQKQQLYSPEQWKG